ncbi:MAG: hypothetical protein ABIJ61_01130 [bacterium]
MIEPLIEHLFYPLLTKYRGSGELALLKNLRRSQYYPEDQLQLLRLERLRSLLRHAEHFVPFYRRRFQAAGFDPKKLKDFAELRKLPVLTKEEIQTHRDELISSYYRPEQLTANRTGGSTGAPLVFYHNRERLDARQAATLRHNEWAGYKPGVKAAIVWGHPGDLSLYSSVKARVRNRLIDRTMLVDAADLSDANIEEFVRRYRRFKPAVILAYANSLALIVDYCVDEKIELPSPQAVITSAEVLTESNRHRIERFFNCRIFDRYGCREVSVIASECEAHEGLHINAENLYLEVLPKPGERSPGGEGDLLITDLGNFAFPFIRYQIGDLVAPLAGRCSCGRTLPRLQMIAGRTTDFLLAPDGSRVSGAALTIHLVAEVPGVRQAQIVQREPEKLIFNLVADANFTDDARELLKSKVRKYFGESMQVELNPVESIPKEPSGKYRFSICEL